MHNKEEKDRVLITGAHGMLGSYVRQVFSDYPLLLLGLSEKNDIRCDLRSDTPEISKEIEGVVHIAGTESEQDAESLNYGGVERLLSGLESKSLKWIVYISSHKVYGSEGEDFVEELVLHPDDVVGDSKMRAEKMLQEWCESRGVTLTILRPAPMFGSGIKGEMARLFGNVIKGRYVHVRGNNAKISLCTALDVAKAAKQLYATGGIYNVADNKNPRFIDLIEGMTINAGALKRPAHLPPAWVDMIWKCLRFIPIIDEMFNPEMLKRRATTKTLCADKLMSTGFGCFDTLEVISRESKDYPYQD